MTAKFANLKGVYSRGIHSGIKKNAAKKDLSFIYVPEACASAAVFTLNKFAASCVSYSKSCFDNGVVKAVVINSGNANAATGEQGFNNTVQMAKVTAKKLGLKPEEVAVASTGIIGEQMPIETVLTGLNSLLEDPKAKDAESTAEAILTTDLCAKSVHLEKVIAGTSYTVSGITKGSGMIAPNMATMLGFLLTDVKISSSELAKLFSKAVSDSFNMITVDNDTSTNDMALIFATGEKDLDLTKHGAEYFDLLKEACIVLAKKIIEDGEGSKRVIEITVLKANTEDEAKRIALSIANSPLVKTAMHGADPNWGRIMAAAGKTPNVALDPDCAELFLQGVEVFKNGRPSLEDRKSVSSLLRVSEVKVELILNQGSASATAWGCELTKGYIDINTAYS